MNPECSHTSYFTNEQIDGEERADLEVGEKPIVATRQYFFEAHIDRQSHQSENFKIII